jgi:energy-coupling factor transport system ATP-binding protein
MITLSQISQRIVNVPTLSIDGGAIAVIGPNGSGKTTLLEVCAGLTIPAQGTVLIDGTPPRKTEVAWVSSAPDRNILFSTVRDEIASPCRFAGLSCQETESAVDEVCDRLGITHLLDRLTRTLSGGEKGVVALATALVKRPTMLVLDEFDAYLDHQTLASITRLMQPASVRYLLFCTQNMALASVADQVIFLKDGHVLASGRPEDVFDQVRTEGFCPLFPGMEGA